MYLEVDVKYFDSQTSANSILPGWLIKSLICQMSLFRTTSFHYILKWIYLPFLCPFLFLLLISPPAIPSFLLPFPSSHPSSLPLFLFSFFLPTSLPPSLLCSLFCAFSAALLPLATLSLHMTFLWHLLYCFVHPLIFRKMPIKAAYYLLSSSSLIPLLELVFKGPKRSELNVFAVWFTVIIFGEFSRSL